MTRRRKLDWPESAGRLAVRVTRKQLHPAAMAAATASPIEEPWAVAFSGGADSLMLLLLIWALWPERRKKLTALHFNHRLRGAASDRDERFCREVAVGLGVRLRVGKWTKRVAGASEAEARAARHAFFGAELSRLQARVLWLGHQQDDIAETMFMRIARGSGTAGLAAPRPVQTMSDARLHLRPLLSLKKSELLAYLREERLPWREDRSNARGVYLRNRVRRDVLPVWQHASDDRDAIAGAALSRELLDEDDVALEQWLSEIDPLTKRGELNLRRLAGRPRAIVRRALQQWLAVNAVGKRFSRQAVSALLNDIVQRRVTRHSLGSNGFAVLTKSRLRFLPARRKLSN
ncbi:MAG: tRNA lysidine(34) synthetase TilS [Opitutus sp.]